MAGGLYADPAIYDILHAPGTAAEVDTFERVEHSLAATTLRHDRLWFEPACGTGRYLKTAAARGRRTAGFDLDPAMIAYAARRPTLEQANLFIASFTDFRSGLAKKSVDFAFNPVNSLRHLQNDRAMLAHFEQMAAVLKPGSLYVVGISLTDYEWLEPEEDLWQGTRGRCRVQQLVNYLPPEPGTGRARRETVISHLAITRPRGVEHRDATYDLRCYDRKQWRNLVKKSALEHVGSFDGQGLPLEGRTLPYQLEALRRTR